MQLKHILFIGLAMVCIGALHSCSKSSGYGSTGGNPYPPADTTPAVSVQLKTDSHFGSVLTDQNGFTLYFFGADADGTSACTGGCLAVWPVFYIANPSFGTGLSATDFATITRSDGTKQTTYKGWPLYKYAPDDAAGDIKGDGVGKIWFVAKPDYTVMIVETQLVGSNGTQYDSTYTAGTGKTVLMTDDHGITLYSFKNDKSGTNTYTASDFSNDANWPILQINNIQNVPSVLNKSDFAYITVFTKPQMTYKGWPVYHFAGDAQTRGNTKGVSIGAPGTWRVMDQFSPTAPQ